MRNRLASVNFLERMHRTTPVSKVTRISTGAAVRTRRLARVRAANLVLIQFGLTLADWEGANYQLSSRTGRTEIVDNLAQVWQAAERILGRACDPLDLSVIARMKQIRRTD